MKKMLLAKCVAALLLATGAAHAAMKSGKQVSDNATFANGFPKTNWLRLDGLTRPRARQSLLRPKRYLTF